MPLNGGLETVSHPGDPERLEGGIKTSIRHQRKALDSAGIDYIQGFQEDSDILHVNVPSPGSLLYIRKARKNGIPVVIHTHEIGENYSESFRFSTYMSPFVRRYVDFFYRRADLLVCPSSYAAKVLEERGIETPKKVVTNGIDPERFKDIERETRETRSPHVVNLSLVFERKGLTDFIETARKLEDMEFTWYGKRFHRILTASPVDRKIDNASNNTEFPGFIDKASDAFSEADIFFFPTKSETEGLSVMEAAYCGLPVVIRDIPVYEDIFEHGKDCLKAESIDGFAEQLGRLRDPDLRQEIGGNAHETAKDYTLDKMGEKLVEAYKEVSG